MALVIPFTPYGILPMGIKVGWLVTIMAIIRKGIKVELSLIAVKLTAIIWFWLSGFI
jgi:L-cystine uptake protein TcyP (sodium:dicarboxylate symporter family)